MTSVGGWNPTIFLGKEFMFLRIQFVMENIRLLTYKRLQNMYALFMAALVFKKVPKPHLKPPQSSLYLQPRLL